MKKRAAVLFSACFFSVSHIASAATIHVDAQASADGTSWCDAYLTLYDALAVASGEDTIKIANGTYIPDAAGLDDPRDATFQLVSGVTIEGGYAGCGAANPDLRDIAGNETVLSGDVGQDDVACPPESGPSDCCTVHESPGYPPFCDDYDCEIDVCTYGDTSCCNLGPRGWDQVCADWAAVLCGCLCGAQDNSENAYHVVTASGTDASTTILDGVTITGGNANNFEDKSIGAGVYLAPVTDTGATLENCTIRDNSAGFSVSAARGGGGGLPDLGLGAGIYNDGGTLTLTDCTLSGNTASVSGGGLYNDSGVVVLDATVSPPGPGCTLSGNTAGVEGGGLYNNAGSVTANDCTFSNNDAEDAGGGMYTIDGSPTLTNCTFQNNSALSVSTSLGGGLFCSGSVSPTQPMILTDCTFSANTAHLGAGIRLDNAAEAEITNSQFLSNVTSGSSGHGGGIHISGASTAVIQGSPGINTFENNTAGNGAGIAIEQSQNVLVLDGCSFVGNSATNNGGGGVYTGALSFSTITIQNNCVFDGNTASATGSTGGAISVEDSEVNIDDAQFINNEADFGGAISAARFGAVMIIHTSLISNNFASKKGGGVYIDETGFVSVNGCTVEFNGRKDQAVTQEGGGLWYEGYTFSDSLVISSIIRNNEANDGAGLFLQGVTWVYDCTIADNEAAWKGGGIGATSTSYLWIQYSRIVSNTSHGDGGGIFTWTAPGGQNVPYVILEPPPQNLWKHEIVDRPKNRRFSVR